MTSPWPSPQPNPLPGPPRTWPAAAAPTMPPAPWTHDPNTVAHLTAPRPGTVETTDGQACGWCQVRIDQGQHHTRPVHHTPAGADGPVIYGSGYCASMAYEGIPHVGTLPRLVHPAPARGAA